MDVEFKRAEESDLDFLLALRLQTMDHHFRASGMPMTREEHMQRVLHHFDWAEVIVIDGEPSGLLKLVREGTDWHLIQIQILPKLQGRGLGEQIISKVLSGARRAGASVRLGVLKVNPAQRLYARLGFEVVEETSDSLKMRWTN